MAYRFSAQAAEDIFLLYQSGKRSFGERAAELYYQLMLDAADFAARHPLASPAREHLKMVVRTRFFGAHVLVYEIDEPDVLILRVLHQAQDWDDVF